MGFLEGRPQRQIASFAHIISKVQMINVTVTVDVDLEHVVEAGPIRFVH